MTLFGVLIDIVISQRRSFSLPRDIGMIDLSDRTVETLMICLAVLTEHTAMTDGMAYIASEPHG